jgi:hypothetical protein
MTYVIFRANLRCKLICRFSERMNDALAERASSGVPLEILIPPSRACWATARAEVCSTHVPWLDTSPEPSRVCLTPTLFICRTFHADFVIHVVVRYHGDGTDQLRGKVSRGW